MSSSSVTACSRSPSPATPDASEIPDTQMSLKSWRSTVPSNAVSPSYHNSSRTLIAPNPPQNDGEEGIHFHDLVRETVFDRCLTPYPKLCSHVLTVTVQFCPHGASLHICGHGGYFPGPFTASYGTISQDHHTGEHQRPANQTSPPSPSSSARCECSS